MEIVDTTQPGEILVKLNNSGRGEILAYAESGAWAKVQITSMGSGGVEAPTEKPTEGPGDSSSDSSLDSSTN